MKEYRYDFDKHYEAVQKAVKGIDNYIPLCEDLRKIELDIPVEFFKLFEAMYDNEKMVKQFFQELIKEGTQTIANELRDNRNSVLFREHIAMQADKDHFDEWVTKCAKAEITVFALSEELSISIEEAKEFTNLEIRRLLTEEVRKRNNS